MAYWGLVDVVDLQVHFHMETMVSLQRNLYGSVWNLLYL